MSQFDKDSLGSRMKGFESIPKNFVMPRTPVIIRVDGKAFHTFTRKFKSLDPSEVTSPFGNIMHDIMLETARCLVEQMQNAVIAYVQSDEISILLRDWDTHKTEQWFNGNVQKIASVTASIATGVFNYRFAMHAAQFRTSNDIAYFDARVFNVPTQEVTNYFIWRQQDASRNSVLMLGHFHFSQKEMHCKNNNEVQDMLMLQKGINWNDLDTWKKRGACAVVTASGVQIDHNIPIFTQDRQYIERLLTVEE